VGEKIRNNIIAISGTPVSGKSTAIKNIKAKLIEDGYKEENIHLVKTGQQFRDAFNSVVSFMSSFEQSPEELMRAYQDDMFQLFLSKKEYRDAVFETMARLRMNKVNLSEFTIEQANEAEEFAPVRAVIDSLIDQRSSDMGKEINSVPRPDEFWIFDSRLAFHMIPDAFSVRLICDDGVAAERLFNDQERGTEDRNYKDVGSKRSSNWKKAS
jgi:cytidylate kinase